jgi:hypothetical protein
MANKFVQYPNIEKTANGGYVVSPTGDVAVQFKYVFATMADLTYLAWPE